jgi:CDP-glucose 4,6-dehydratase
VNSAFWRGKSVLVTGHTGFKGGWLSVWLEGLGAKVTGFALDPVGSPSFFAAVGVDRLVDSRIGDIRDFGALSTVFAEVRPEIVLHLAAQSLVLRSYDEPLETYGTNVMGTANLLECVRRTTGVRAAVIVTSDKCYENREWEWGYRECDRLGGKDPYSNSKACAELVTQSFRDSYFSEGDGSLVASVRAGNVIGGGDWGDDRIVPDLVRASMKGEAMKLRDPSAVRPWQFVLDPLYGYLLVAERLYEGDRSAAAAWNFGPDTANFHSVADVVETFGEYWERRTALERPTGKTKAETKVLKVDSTKARSDLYWKCQLGFSAMMDWTVAWYKGFADDSRQMEALTRGQIRSYLELTEAHRARAT